MQPPPPAATRPPRNRPVAIVVGLLLVAPAGIACLIGYVWPSLRTAWFSVRDASPLRPDSEFVGFDNYEFVTSSESEWLGSFGYALSFAIPVVLVLVLVAPLLALAAAHAGRAGRWVVRLALAAPMVSVVPVALAIGWRLDDRIVFTSLEAARNGVRAAMWLGMFGLVCGLGVTLYLSALRRGRGEGHGPPWAAAGVLAAFAVLATIAVTVQSFTFPQVISGGGPADATTTPMFDTYIYAFRNGDYGAGAAQATLVLIPVVVLGVAATLLVVLTGLRVEVAAPERPGRWDPVRVVALVGTVLLLGGVLAVTAYGLWPWLSRLGFGPYVDDISVPATLARTWLPPLVSTVVGVGLAAVAAFGIGALRPLGRWSELLLLPFAPWLFIGVGPLMLSKYDTVLRLDQTDTVLGWIPPIWLVVPALLLFTLLFRGLADSGRSYGRMLLWALPMVALVGAATWLVQSQSLLWNWLTGFEDTLPATVWLIRTTEMFAIAADDIGFGLLLPIPLVAVLALGLMAAQLFYLDRLAIRIGHPDTRS